MCAVVPFGRIPRPTGLSFLLECQPDEQIIRRSYLLPALGNPLRKKWWDRPVNPPQLGKFYFSPIILMSPTKGVNAICCGVVSAAAWRSSSVAVPGGKNRNGGLKRLRQQY
ncbi:MAG TPA: hypothetical protein DDW52_09595 [Planctomycetaceae bacterium]|nr:hypothetical protein [Planctomycetaceae bacterium]